VQLTAWSAAVITGQSSIRLRIRAWWRQEGKRLYPNAQRLLFTAGAEGSNGWLLRLWKVELQKFTDQSGLTVSVYHFR
jgi:hypothetical protein